MGHYEEIDLERLAEELVDIREDLKEIKELLKIGFGIRNIDIQRYKRLMRLYGR